MVVRAGGYYGPPLKLCRGVTQGYPLSPTLFNVVVNTVIHHVAATEVGTNVLGLSMWYLAVYLYAENGLVASTQLERLQRAFDVFQASLTRSASG